MQSYVANVRKTKMISGPLFKCFGSKWLSSKRLPAPVHDTIVEPFAGGAGYSLRHYSKSVVLYEINSQVRELWQWLITTSESSIREMPVGIPVGTDIRTLGLSYGQTLLMKNWQRTNNVGNCWTVSPWGNSTGQWTENCRARVAEESQLIKHWKIGEGGWENAFEHHTPATYLVDPPYQFNYNYRTPPIDYEKLALACLSRVGQVVVCEARHPKTGEIPKWLPFLDWEKRVTSRRGPTGYSKELLCVFGR